MKKFKRILLCAAACVTACSVTALTACTDNEPSDGLSSDVTITTAMSASQLNEQLEKFDNLSTSLTLSGGLTVTKMGGETVNMAIANILAKANLEGGNADVELSLNSLLFGDDSDAPSTGNKPLALAEGDTEEGSEEGAEEGGEEAPEMMIMNVFLRDWKAFYPNTDEGVDGEYNYKDLGMGSNDLEGIATGNIYSMISGGFMQDSEMLLKIANSTDSIVVDETKHTISLDINKMVYGMYGYIKEIVNNLTETTTVSGLLKCSAVRYYVEACLGDTTADDIYEVILAAILEGESGTPYTSIVEGSPLAGIIPKQGEKAYDYIVRLLNSQDFATITGEEEPVGATKIVDMMGEDAAQALETIKSMVTLIDAMNIVTETSVTIPSMPGGLMASESAGMASLLAGSSFSGITLVYTFDEENVLQEVEFGGKISAVVEKTAVEMELALNIAFTSEAITEFEEIGSYTVNVYDEANSTMIVKTVAEILGSAN